MKRTVRIEGPDGSVTIVTPDGQRFVLYPRKAIPCGRWLGAKPKPWDPSRLGSWPSTSHA